MSSSCSWVDTGPQNSQLDNFFDGQASKNVGERGPQASNKRRQLRHLALLKLGEYSAKSFDWAKVIKIPLTRLKNAEFWSVETSNCVGKESFVRDEFCSAVAKRDILVRYVSFEGLSLWAYIRMR